MIQHGQVVIGEELAGQVSDRQRPGPATFRVAVDDAVQQRQQRAGP